MKLKPMRLRGKGALLTDGARGIGPAISLGLAREGAKIVVNYLKHSFRVFPQGKRKRFSSIQLEGLNASLDD